MATAEVSEWDAQGNPVQSQPASAASEWDAQGNPLHSMPEDNPPPVPKAPIPAGLQGPPPAVNTPSKWMSPRGGMLNTGIDALSNFGSHLVAPFKAAGQALIQGPQNPEEAKDFAESLPGTKHLTLASNRLLLNPAVDALKESSQLREAGGPQSSLTAGSTYNEQGQNVPTAGSRLVDAIPIYGPWARNAENEAHQKGNIVAGAGVLGDVAAAKTSDAVGKKTGSAFKERTPVPSENFTPRQAKSHAAVVAEGNAGGDTGYIPQDIADATGSKLRQIAADNPEVANVVRTGSPKEAFAAHQNLLSKAKAEIDLRHNDALAPVADTSVDMKPVQNAIKPDKYDLQGMDEADQRSFQELQDRAGKVQDLGGLNKFRQQLSTEDTTLKNPMATGKSALYPQAVHKLYGAVRDAYYDALGKATGQDFTADKRLEGNIIAEQRGALNAGNRLATSEARQTAPQSAGGVAADLVEGAAHGRGPGIPVVSAFASKLRGTPLGQVQQHLQRFYSDLPNPSAPAAPPTAAAPVPTPRALPNPQLQLPASVIPNGEVSAPGTPASQPPTAQGPPGFSVSPEGTARPGAPAPATPSVITPTPDAQLQLPAQAGPEGQGAPPPSPPTAPPLNQATAAQSTRAPLPPNPQPTPPGRTTVTPEGTAIPQRLQLPAPTKTSITGQALTPGTEVTINGRKGTFTGFNPKTGKAVIKWK